MFRKRQRTGVPSRLSRRFARIESGFEFKAWVNDDRGSPIGLGHELQYHFQSARRSSLLVIHVDSTGKGSLLFPNELGIDNRLEPDTALDFPAEGAAFALKAECGVLRNHEQV